MFNIFKVTFNKFNGKGNRENTDQNRAIHEKKKKHWTMDNIFNRSLKKLQVVIADGKRTTARESMFPDGFDANHNSYVKIIDSGITYYCMSLYVEKLPREPAIATQFSTLMNFNGVTTTVYILPLNNSSISKVDKRITSLETEEIIARKNSDANRLRKLEIKKRDAERWGIEIDSGHNTLFEVGILVQLYSESLTDLRQRAVAFNERASKAGFVLGNCYGMQKEAYLAGLPINMPQFDSMMGSLFHITKKHIMDKNALSTIFNHTDVSYYQDDGVVIGYGLWDRRLVSWNPYRLGNTSFGTIVAGKTGYGKSLMIKNTFARMIEILNLHVVCVDVEQRGMVGEYAWLASGMAGINIKFSNDSKEKLNLFDINEEEVFDEVTGKTYRRLLLNDKIAFITNILMIIVYALNLDDVGNTSPFSAETILRMKAIIKKVVRELYVQIGVWEGDADSLYRDSYMEGNKLEAGRIKKRMPQMHQFYMLLLKYSLENTDRFKENAYHLLLDTFADCVENIYYDPITGMEYTKEEYEAFETVRQGPYRGKKVFVEKEDGRVHVIEHLQGANAYFDCQTTIEIDLDYPFINFDISQAPDSAKLLLMLLCWNYIKENFINKNSMNPKEARKLAICIDEAKKLLRYEPGGEFVDNLYRTARKRHIWPIVIVQSIRDLLHDTVSEGILRNTATYMMFKHEAVDEPIIKETLKCTDAIASQIVALGGEDNNKRFGEMCLVDTQTNEKVFVQVDYIKETEAFIMETNQANIAAMYGE